MKGNRIIKLICTNAGGAKRPLRLCLPQSAITVGVPPTYSSFHTTWLLVA